MRIEIDLQEAASSFLSPRVVNYYATASLDHVSLNDNRTSLGKCRLLPRVMRNVKQVRPQTTLFGQQSALPIYVSPASNALLGHPDGELNITRGVSLPAACRRGIPLRGNRMDSADINIGSSNRHRSGHLRCRILLAHRHLGGKGNNGGKDGTTDGHDISDLFARGSGKVRRTD